ncbi:translation elongation factor Ts [Blochmannia endosymbiont of Camponotus (Colobopsis) obliquus]|uniref:translation elongation factor Ts n=1 Tax=Blochmannia endosymbiont of Camponotus (Colobopsis) obliquus TaxID=1505597 RepID=UPI00061A5F63|nr:translation elongation factor Ts [Blochmannia endosymbiont of Camponotus (Colobopsis) obliquus]AKC60438.1 Elongation factor Ts [Blochmannia endosymbiont of Camponotus (Colobopsis) obliquus]
MIKITVDMVKKLRQLTGIGVVECKNALIATKGNIDSAINNIRRLGLIKNVQRMSNLAIEGIILVKVVRNNYGVMLELNCETDFVSKNSIFKDFGNNVLDTAIVECIVDLNLLRLRFEKECNVLMNKFDENIKINRFIVLRGDKLGCYIHNMRIGVIVDGSFITDELLKFIAMHIVASNPKYINENNIPKEVIHHEYEVQMDIAMKSDKAPEIHEKIVSGRMEQFINSVSLLNQPFIMNEKQNIRQLLDMHGAKINNFIRLEVGENIKKDH